MSSTQKTKYYVVWKGIKPGVYNTWEECKKNIEGFKGAAYKSFSSYAAAFKAFSEGPENYINKDNPAAAKQLLIIESQKPKGEFIAVDGAWNTATLQAEYRGVKMPENIEIFTKGPFEKGTNNIMEFLALVHALALCKNNNWTLDIYSDSKTAITWLKKKKANTKLEMEAENTELFKLIKRAEDWLNQNNYNNKVFKWETDKWGEIPADFGRK